MASNSRKGASAKRASSGSDIKKKSISSEERDQLLGLGSEAFQLLFLAFSILLLLGNFSLTGGFGRVVNGFLFGLFGAMEFLFPVFLFLCVSFFIANRGNARAMVRLVGIILLFFDLGIFFQLIFNSKFTSGNYSGLYGFGKDTHAGGGLICGGLYSLLSKLVGNVGTVIIFLVLAIISIVLISGKSFIGGVKSGSKKVYDNTRKVGSEYREKKRIRKEERQRERELNAVDLNKGEMVVPHFNPVPDTAGGVHADMSQENYFSPAPPAKSQGENTNVISIDTVLADSAVNKSDTEESTLQFTNITRRAADENTDRDIFADEIIDEGRLIDLDIKKKQKYDEEHRIVLSDTEFNPYRGAGVIPKTDVESAPEDNAVVELYREKSEGAADDEFISPELMVVPDITDIIEEEARKGQNDGGDVGDIAALLKAMQPDNVEAEEYELPKAEVVGKETEEETGETAESAEKENEPGVIETNIDIVSSPEDEDVDKEKTVTFESKRAIAPSRYEEGEIKPDADKAVKEQREYRLPPVELLNEGRKESVDAKAELAQTAQKLKETLASFGVNVEVTDISRGPSVTRYEVKMEQGVKVSKILSLSDDLQLNLAATDIRIEAPIPGKAAVGIEIPNKQTSTVMLRDIIDSDEFRNEKSKIGFVVGKDIAGQNVVADIEDMPHLLIAGATGSGKSVCVNTIIMSVLYKAKPDEVKLVLIDPKRVELSMYNGLPHLMAPVVTDPGKAAGALHWGVTEMTRRFDLFEKMRVRDLKSYNAQVKKLNEEPHEPEYDENGNELPLPSPLPQVIIIVDEMADLMMVAKSEVETYICRLAQLARAAGIHLIIATQRPSVDVITGLIKANMPSRIAFMVSSGTDSRTILESNGAEKLLGKGDMLFAPRNYPKPERIQAPFVSDNEVQSVVDFIMNENVVGDEDKQDISEEIEAHAAVSSSPGGDGSSSSSAEPSSDGRDEYFKEAGRFIIEKEKASIGILQRQFRIGFNRAARIMDQLAEAGVVSHEDGTKARQILMDAEQFEKLDA